MSTTEKKVNIEICKDKFFNISFAKRIKSFTINFSGPQVKDGLMSLPNMKESVSASQNKYSLSILELVKY